MRTDGQTQQSFSQFCERACKRHCKSRQVWHWVTWKCVEQRLYAVQSYLYAAPTSCPSTASYTMFAYFNHVTRKLLLSTKNTAGTQIYDTQHALHSSPHQCVNGYMQHVSLLPRHYHNDWTSTTGVLLYRQTCSRLYYKSASETNSSTEEGWIEAPRLSRNYSAPPTSAETKSVQAYPRETFIHTCLNERCFKKSINNGVTVYIFIGVFGLRS